jgi:hypothetical protein
MTVSILEVFAKNRAEELPDDLWNEFVLPLDFEEVPIKEMKKAAVLVGGRGTGKTMFIKYHCHATQLSPKRKNLETSALNFIGIHYRPDTSFTPNINEKWVGKRWESVFNSVLSLSILVEFTKLSNNILKSTLSSKTLKEDIANFLIPKAICSQLKIESCLLINGEEFFQDALFELTNWIRLPISENPPLNLDLKQTVLLLIQKLKLKVPKIGHSIFHIFIDEFENLDEEQQKIINSWLKHGQDPLLFSIAHKKYADVTRATKTKERLEERDDFRLIDVEKLYFDPDKPKNFEILAAELVLLKMIEFKDLEVSKALVAMYSDVSSIDARKESQYQSKVKKQVNRIFPSMSFSEIAKEVVNDEALFGKLKKTLIEDALKKNKKHNCSPNDFIDKNYPEASIVNGVLLHRSRTNIDELKSEFDVVRRGEASKNYDQWIQNNLVGALIYIYNTLPNRICPIYAGFSEFILMSKGNLRHFLELCFQSLTRAHVEHDIFKDNVFHPVPIDTQARATLVTSTSQFGRIENAGAYGRQLQKVAQRLGILFSLHQKRKTQSEPEINHFSIGISDVSLLDVEVQKLLNESLVWSVLKLYKSTKNKTETDIEQSEYLLHPVLSCYFGISPRKKRKIKLLPEQVNTIFVKPDKEFNKLLEVFRKKLNIEEDENTELSNTQIRLSW